MKILVIGDSCLDKFIYCSIDRICPEAPVPVLKPLYEECNDGMSLNVVANLKALGVSVDYITNDNIIQKIRYVDERSGQLVVRIDINDSCNRIVNFPHEINYDALIISDYCKGFLTEEDIHKISLLSKCPVFLDTKKNLGDWANNVDFIKINEFEYRKNYDLISNNSYLTNKLIITQGSKGCEYQKTIFQVPKVPIKDVSGAGDTFLAGLVFNYIKTKDIKKSIEFANKCATIVVQKHGVSVVNLNEI